LLGGCNYLLRDALPDNEQDAGAPDAGVEEEIDSGPPPVPDETPPDIELLAPEEDCLDGAVTFRLRVTDADSAVGLVTARFAGNDLTLSDEGGGVHSAPFDASTLFRGFHTLSVTAIDTSNNLAELDRTFGHVGDGEYLEGTTFDCGEPPDAGPGDLLPPEVELLTPMPGSTAFASDTLAVSVRVTDDVGPVTVVATIGTESATLIGATELFSGQLDTSGVAEGAQTLTVEATDDAARTGDASRSVTIDHTPPSVSIVEPTAGATRAAFTDVVAVATDDNGVERVTLFEVGDTEPLGYATDPVPGETDRYGVIYRLPCAGLPRSVTFRVVARDVAGNTASDEVTVTVDTTGCG
jgi:hypothetical protein